MNHDVATTFMATLLMIGLIGVIASWFAASVRAIIDPMRRQLAALVAVAAALSSLYLSEIVGFVPCQYCWWQRIFLYPLAIILPIALWRRDRAIRAYVMPLAGIGLLISLRHVWLQLFPAGESCSATAPCTSKLVEAYGFVTIPMMAAACFVLILALLAGAAVPGDADASTDPSPQLDPVQEES